jgi:hypothetical protein
MPHAWTIIEGTPDRLKRLWGDPEEFKAEVGRMLEETQSGSGLGEVYFHWRKGASKAYVLIDFPPDSDVATLVRAMQEKFETDKVYDVLSASEKRAQLEAAI